MRLMPLYVVYFMFFNALNVFSMDAPNPIEKEFEFTDSFGSEFDTTGLINGLEHLLWEDPLNSELLALSPMESPQVIDPSGYATELPIVENDLDGNVPDLDPNYYCQTQTLHGYVPLTELEFPAYKVLKDKEKRYVLIGGYWFEVPSKEGICEMCFCEKTHLKAQKLYEDELNITRGQESTTEAIKNLQKHYRKSGSKANDFLMKKEAIPKSRASSFELSKVILPDVDIEKSTPSVSQGLVIDIKMADQLVLEDYAKTGFLQEEHITINYLEEFPYSDTILRRLLNVIAQKSPRLKFFELNVKRSEIPQLIHLAHILKANKTLKLLSYRGDGIGNRGTNFFDNTLKSIGGKSMTVQLHIPKSVSIISHPNRDSDIVVLNTFISPSQTPKRHSKGSRKGKLPVIGSTK